MIKIFLISISFVICSLGCTGHSKEAQSSGGTEDGLNRKEIIDSECEYRCSGIACNTMCENEILYSCSSSNKWEKKQNCGAEGKKCKLELIDQGPQAHHFCK